MKPMLWLRQFRIRTRMTGAILMVLAMFGLIGATGALGGLRLTALNTAFMSQSIDQARSVATINASLAEVRRAEKDMVIDYEDGVAVLKHRERWAKAIANTRKGLESLLEGPEDEGNPLARNAIARLQEYQKASEPVLQQIQDGGYDTTKAVDKMLGRAKSLVAQVESEMLKIDQIVVNEAKVSQAEFNRAMLQMLWVFAGVLAVIVLLVVPLTLLNSRSITGPIGYARTVAQAIASGDLSSNIRVEGKDEAADLMVALNQMQESLRHLVGQVRGSAEQIRVASTEVAAGNADLSNRTEQASSSLQQTASSMEQLTGNVRQSSESASQANQLAGSASAVAKRGGQVVAQVVATMDEINTSSKRIGDIIGVIDSIAFQTNILALNAAVEAARAGEQGRGFAVVASEVRSLAGRSAEAAREIKSLIGASTEKVESGARLVRDAGATMDDIVASVQRVTDIITEISAAATEQSAGIGQVNTEVNQLDQMTQQNAALVEQSAAAAESLKEQASNLARVVGTFRLGSHQGADVDGAGFEPVRGSQPA
jgi:methyl-accepting chemotaxis protein